MPSSEPDSANPAKQAQYMLQVCDAFLARDALAVIVGLLADPLSRHPKMTDKDTALVELVITFLRNLLTATIPAAGATSMQEEAGRRVRTNMLERLFADDVLDLVLLMAQHARERPFKSQANILLEFFLCMFSDVTPESLLKADETLATQEEESAKAKAAAKMRAQAQRPRPPTGRGALAMPPASKGKTIINKGPLKSQYAAALYTRRHLDHGAGVLVRHTPSATELPAIQSVTNPKHKKAQVKESESGPASIPDLSGTSSLRMAKLSVKLKTYLATFLQEAYTPLVGQVFKDIKVGIGVSMLEEDDFERFQRFVAFCTKYARLREESRLKQRMDAARAGRSSAGDAGEDSDRSPFECLSSTMGWDAFHAILVLIQMARDREVSRNKDKALKNIPRRNILLNSVGSLLKEMLLTLDLARFVGNSADRHAADRLQIRLGSDESKDSNIFQIIAVQIKNFSFAVHSREHAVNMAEVLHIILGMLERLTGSTGGLMMRHQVKQRLRRASHGGVGDATQGAVLQSPAMVNGTSPLEPSSNGPNKETTGGTADESPVVDLTGDTAGGGTAKDVDGGGREEKLHAEEAEKSSQAPADPSPAAAPPRAPEVSPPRPSPPKFKDIKFDLEKHMLRELATPLVIQFHIWLLQGYRTNSAFTNLAITSFLSRLSEPKEKGGLGLHTMLWQLSVLRVFHTIMSDPAVRGDPQKADLLKLCLRITRGLFARLVPEDTPRPAEDNVVEDIEIVLDGSEEGAGEGLEGEALRKKQLAELEPKMKEGCASMGFMELLFWKKVPPLAQSIAEEYHWQVRFG